MSMADLVAAGAPELPEGWFYRVVDTHTVGLKVEIREPRKRFGSRELSSMYVYEERHSHPMPAIVEACTRAYALVQDRDIARARFDALLPFIGDHDPKGGR